MAYPFGRWVWIDGLPDGPMIAFVYFDPEQGVSAKGGRAGDPNLATMPSHTVRLAGFEVRELSADEVRVHELPARPAWLTHYGPQPDAEAPWRGDPLLAGKFHPQFPDDTQALVHDGDPRRTRISAEQCWVRLHRVEPAPTRALFVIEQLGSPLALPSPYVYVGELLNQPHALQSVKRGEPLKLISVHGMPNLLQVTDAYLRERANWAISPCNKCGATEVFDPPSVMGKFRFPGLPEGGVLESFTSFCTMCGGMQMLKHIGERALPRG